MEGEVGLAGADAEGTDSPGHQLAGDTVALCGDGSACASWYDDTMMHLDETVAGVLAVACAAGAAWQHVLVPRWEAKRKRIAECGHTLVLDAVPPPDVIFSKLRCSKGCGYQEDATEHIAQWEVARQDRLDALRIRACPHCGSEDR